MGFVQGLGFTGDERGGGAQAMENEATEVLAGEEASITSSWNKGRRCCYQNLCNKPKRRK